MLEECIAAVVRALKKANPLLGWDVAIYASDMPAYANGQRYKYKGGPEREKYSDPDASWGHRSSVSTRKGGGFYGYRIHMAVCAKTDLPLAWTVETARALESGFEGRTADEVDWFVEAGGVGRVLDESIPAVSRDFADSLMAAIPEMIVHRRGASCAVESFARLLPDGCFGVVRPNGGILFLISNGGITLVQPNGSKRFAHAIAIDKRPSGSGARPAQRPGANAGSPCRARGRIAQVDLRVRGGEAHS